MPRVMNNQLNEKEKRVFAAFPTEKDDKGGYTYVGLSDLAGKAFNKRGIAPKTKGNSWVRNSMRKLLALKLVQMKGARSGLYRLTGTVPPEPKLADEQEAPKNGVKKAAKKKAAKKTKAKTKTKSKSKAKDKDKDLGDGEKLDESAEADSDPSSENDGASTDDDDDDADDDDGVSSAEHSE